MDFVVTLRNVIPISMLSSGPAIPLQSADPSLAESEGFRLLSRKIGSSKLDSMPRKKTALPRPRTGNQRNPLLHKAIIDAATEVLEKDGPKRFTIEAVAKLAGCGKPTIYRWWQSRPALLLEVYERAVDKELVEPEAKDLAKDLSTTLRQVWRFWREECMGSLYRLILAEMMLEEEGTRYLREVFIPRRQAFAGRAFQAAIDRGEIPEDTDVKLLMDMVFGFSMFHLITETLDDDEVPDRIGATIAKLAQSGIARRTEKRSRVQRIA
jgi:AcrR family transcriptional regulator